MPERPDNINFLSPLGYKFVLGRAPNIEYFTQRISVPGLNLPPATTPSPFVRVPIMGDHIEFDSLTVTFRINENMDNYLEIYDWLVALDFPEKYTQYNLRHSPADGPLDADKPYGSTLSDITVSILSSAQNPNINILCRDCHPIALSPIDFDSTLTDVQYIEATATFAVRDFTITKL